MHSRWSFGHGVGGSDRDAFGKNTHPLLFPPRMLPPFAKKGFNPEYLSHRRENGGTRT
jgi:hypothetical protein